MVSNSAGDDSASTYVFISPYITTQPEDSGGPNGSKVILLCEAEAFPSPQYQWKRVDGVPIRDTVLGVNSTMLFFNPLVFGDEGSYFCNAILGGVTTQSNLVTMTGNRISCIYVYMGSWIGIAMHGHICNKYRYLPAIN